MDCSIRLKGKLGNVYDEMQKLWDDLRGQDMRGYGGDDDNDTDD